MLRSMASKEESTMPARTRCGGWPRALVALGLVGLFAAPTGAAAPERPLMLGVLVDTSGSIPRRDEAARTRLVSELVQALPAGSQVALFAFDDTPRLLVPLTPRPAEIAKAVAGLHGGGRYTALNDAIFDAVTLLREAPTARRAVLVITDGLDENSALVAEDGVQAAREHRIPVFTAGIGAVQERTLRRIAKLTGGEYFAPRSKPTAVTARLLALTPDGPPPSRPSVPLAPAPAAQAAAATAPGPPPAPVTVDRAPASPISMRVLLGTIGALVLLGAALGFVYWRRPRPTRAPEAWEVAPGPVDEPTIISRHEGLGSADSTLVLTLKPLLHVTKGPNFGKFFEVSLEAATSIGRAQGNDVVLDDRAVSGQHCRVRPSESGGFEVLDLRSTNGTYVNEKKVAREKLTAGDVIKVGETLMQFRMDHMKQ
jgi:hypothetical protein